MAQEKDLKIVSRPNLVPEKLEEGKDAKFKATFEVYPEVSIAKLSKLSYTNFLCTITDEDLDSTINNLQKRMSKWESSEEPSKDGDQVKINFIGKIDGEEFEGGSANDFPIELGSKSMIEGFEDGLIGLSKDEEKTLELKFPDDYGKAELASKSVNFEIKVIEVSKAVLPELDEEFFKGTGIEAKDTEDYKKQVLGKLEEDLDNILKGKVRQNLYDSLVEANEFDVPKAMIDSEISNMKLDTARRMGMDPKDMKDDLFPNETFEEEALKRVKIGMLLNKIIEEYPESPFRSKSLFALVFVHEALGDTISSVKARNTILTEFSGSDYAMYLSDDSTAKKPKEQEVMLMQAELEMSSGKEKAIDLFKSVMTMNLDGDYSVSAAYTIGYYYDQESLVDLSLIHI